MDTKIEGIYTDPPAHKQTWEQENTQNNDLEKLKHELTTEKSMHAFQKGRADTLVLRIDAQKWLIELLLEKLENK